jgi:hypothetical protein
MITNADYLIQRYAEAREKTSSYTDGTKYWNGVMDAYHAMLNESFPGWADNGTTGYYVFYEGMTYDAALNALEHSDPNWCHYSGMPSPQAYSSNHNITE